MNSIIQDIWIISQSGIVIFKRVFNQGVSDDLFVGFFNALKIVADMLSNGNISEFELNSIKYFTLKNNNFLFIGSSAKNVKEKKVQEELKKIAKKFFDKYSVEWLKNDWNGEIDIFSDFEKEILNPL
ncbi:MAG: hypothetical protein ACFFAH_06520 [Promethearchaeota archaeon]